MSATPIKTTVRHPLRYWGFWITAAVIAALSATFAACFLLGGLIAWNMTPPDRILDVVLFGLSTISQLSPTSFFLRIAGRVPDPDGVAKNAETGSGGGRDDPLSRTKQERPIRLGLGTTTNNTQEEGKWKS